MPRKPYPTDVSDEGWSFAGPYLTLMEEAAPQRRSAAATCAKSSTPCAGWSVQARPGVFCPMTFLHGRRSTSRGGAGCKSVALSRWSAICARSSAWPRADRASPARSCLMAARCSRVARADRVQAATATSAGEAARCTWLSIRSAICWRYM